MLFLLWVDPLIKGESLVEVGARIVINQVLKTSFLKFSVLLAENLPTSKVQ